VKADKGSPGVDDSAVHELPGYLKQHWPAIRKQLLSGTGRVPTTAPGFLRGGVFWDTGLKQGELASLCGSSSCV